MITAGLPLWIKLVLLLVAFPLAVVGLGVVLGLALLFLERDEDWWY